MQNIAIIGPGRMGMHYAKIIAKNPRARLVAFCGHGENHVKEVGTEFGVAVYVNDEWAKMFDEHPEIDTVVITTPESAHVAPALEAARREKNIILEKPMTTSLADAEMLSEAFKKNDVKVAQCFTSRFNPYAIKAHHLEASGSFGKIGYMYSRRIANLHAAERVQGKFPLVYWLTCHDIDLMRWFIESEVTEVTAFESDTKTKGNFIHANLLFKNGARGLIEISWFAPERAGDRNEAFDIEAERGRIEVDCSGNSIAVFGEDGVKQTPLVEKPEGIGVPFLDNAPVMIDSFLGAFEKGKEPSPNAHDGLASIRVCDAIDRSMKERRTITL